MPKTMFHKYSRASSRQTTKSRVNKLLLSHPGRVFSKQAIYDYAWEEMYLGEDKTINVHISNIRKKLRGVSDREYIETVWGIGFRLAP